jgi:cytosine/adenosine deaminase-related metal-dependent hydrolase
MMELKERRVSAIGFTWALLLSVAPLQAQSETVYDLVILNGRVIDPASGVDAVRNLGISGGTIRAVTTAPLAGRQIIDAAGLVVAPGFIDTDTYVEHAALQVLDGVTTALALLVGTTDVDAWYRLYEGRMPIHYGVSIDYSQVREELRRAGVSQRVQDAPWETDLAPVLHDLERGLRAGAAALSLGLGATLDVSGTEIRQAFELAARHGAHVVATLPDRYWTDDRTTADLLSVIGAASITGAAIHIPHIGSTGGPRVMEMLEMIATARGRGVRVTAEDYPYAAALGSLGPGEADEWPDEELHDVQPLGFGQRLTRETYAQFRDRQILVYWHNRGLEPYLPAALAHPWMSIASHANPPSITERGWGHPRTVGTYGRLFGTYVREQQLMTLAEAIRKSSLMPAERLQDRIPAMARKGRLHEGADADVVVFDASRFAERATFDSLVSSEGMRFVIVAGRVVVREGELLDVMAGLPVRAPVRP